MHLTIVVPLLLLLSSLGLAQEASQPFGNLNIHWIDSKKSEGTPPDDQMVKEACKKLGANLSSKSGLWASGVFQGFNCSRNGKSLDDSSNSNDWILRIEDAGMQVNFSIAKGREKMEGAKPQFSLQSSPWVAEFLRDEVFLGMLSLTVQLSLPAMIIFEDNQVEAKVLSDRTQTSAPIPPPPPRLDSFKYLEGEFRKVGEGVLNGGHYRLDQPSIQSRGGERIFGRPSEASPQYTVPALNVRYRELVKAKDPEYFERWTKSLASTLANEVNESIKSGYVGLRFGFSIVKDTPLLPKSRMYGLLYELRGGSLSGLKVYVDWVPEVSEEFQGETIRYAWNRALIGQTFHPASGTFLEFIGITPKIGRWAFQADLPVQKEDGNSEIERFPVSSALSLGLEIEAERATQDYIARAWASQDLTLPIGQNAVTGTRYGLDLFVNGPVLVIGEMAWNVSLLIFAFGEQIEVSQSEGDKRNLSVSSGYAGLGVSFSW